MAIDMPDIEAAAAADTVAGEIANARAHALPIGTPCPNCATRLAGPWCYNCGQKGEKYDRSIWRLMGEALEGLTHFDGRFWTTGPRLIFRPGKLTHDYLNGHRAAQLPPFRIFLIVLLVVFFAGGVNVQSTDNQFKIATLNDPEVQSKLSAKQRTDIAAMTATLKSRTGSRQSVWWRDRVLFAMEHEDAFYVALETWGHRFAILMLPVAAVLLTLLFAFKRGVYVFDHLIFSMHSLSFQGLLLSAVFLAGLGFSGAGWLLLLSPIHLFVHMRGAYRIGVLGTLIRMILLFVGSCVAVGFLLAGLVMVGLATAH